MDRNYFLLLNTNDRYQVYERSRQLELLTDPNSVLPNVTTVSTDPGSPFVVNLLRDLTITLNSSIQEGSMADHCSSIVREKGYPTDLIDFVETRLMPVLLLISFLVNSLVAILLMQRSMQSPSNSILLGIAIADLCSSLLPLPFQMIYAIDRNFLIRNTWLAYTYQYLSVELPTLAHTMSVWLTILLAVQRYFFICRPMEANQRAICKQRPVHLMMFGIFLAVVLFQVPMTVPLSFNYAIFHKSLPENGILGSLADAKGLEMNVTVYKCTDMTAIYRLTWLSLRTFLVHFGPSMVLIIFTIFLVFALNRISKKRKDLLNNKAARKLSYILANQKSSDNSDPCSKSLAPHSSNNKKCQLPSESSDSISKMMILVLILFLVGEIPTTIQITLYTIYNIKGMPFKLFEFRSIANAFLVMTYPANFFIYCIMSTNFREAFKSFLSWRLKCSRTLSPL